MYSSEGTPTNLSNPNSSPNSTPNLTPSTSSTTVHLRCHGESLEAYNEEMAMSRHFRLEQQELELKQQELEDLKAFEDRLKELANETRPCSFHWIPITGLLGVSTAISACHWLPAVRDSQSVVLRSLSSRGALTLSLATIVLTIIFGARHLAKRRTSGAVELSRDTLALYRLKFDKNDNLVGIPPADHHQTMPRPLH